MSSLYVLTLLVAVALASMKEFRDHGDCDKSRKVLMYIYEPLLNDCFAVRVNSCDEKAKGKHYSLAQCIHKIAETPRCANLSLPLKHSDGSSACNSNDVEARKCPKGAVCKGTICCDAQIETDYLMEKYVTSCDAGVKASRENGQILFSKNCSIDFCPEGAACTMGRHFAFCCPPF
ncbi:hypothetical protein PRIPAC_75653 [Pristionchus pacificus]|uniref:Uncharacterized protein n=1 Tax=Pristionchus pacificus TaxID=54126 RepID=A0A2A6C693_PRIPA|nr:hypothetical protein PRIPAC_75653 [Pristionchus pacificus]|eukprot:PDM73684.1 hypothetical protein PRIPAC_41040 [Pristionchus pacificus]